MRALRLLVRDFQVSELSLTGGEGLFAAREAQKRLRTHHCVRSQGKSSALLRCPANRAATLRGTLYRILSVSKEDWSHDPSERYLNVTNPFTLKF